MRPRRVQLSRARGWRKPPNTVVVARPSRWGNPNRVDAQAVEIVIDLHGHDHWCPNGQARGVAVRLYREQLYAGHLPYDRIDVREQLAGKNLACWCPLDQPCHADVLLELANGPS